VLGSADSTSSAGAPVPLTPDRDTSAFIGRHDSLSAWLSKRALANAVAGASRTDVVCDEQRRVVGYYALAAGSIAAGLIASAAAPGRLRRNMPDPLQVTEALPTMGARPVATHCLAANQLHAVGVGC